MVHVGHCCRLVTDCGGIAVLLGRCAPRTRPRRGWSDGEPSAGASVELVGRWGAVMKRCPTTAATTYFSDFPGCARACTGTHLVGLRDRRESAVAPYGGGTLTAVSSVPNRR